jgi:hypothetical protein
MRPKARSDRDPRDEVFDRMDRGWTELRALVEAARVSGFDRRTDAGWTIGAMLAHLAAWHDATASRLRRYATTRRPQPKIDDDDDAFNARVAEAAVGRADDRILADLDASFVQLRAAVEALPVSYLTSDDGWAEAVLAGNSYEHYVEHVAELEPARTGGR